jgi:hypothetical protein
MRLLLTFGFRLNVSIKFHNLWAFVYDSGEIQMLKAISLVIEQRKNEFYRIEKMILYDDEVISR